MQNRGIVDLVRATFADWSEDKVPKLSAALAYYTVFSIAPLLMIGIAIAGLAFGRDQAQQQIMDELQALLGPQGADILRTMLEQTSKPSTGILALVAGGIGLLLGASGVFGELQDSLDHIWEVKPKKQKGIWALIRTRFLSLLMVLGTGFLLMVSLLLSAGLSAFGKWFEGTLPLPEFVLHAVNFTVSLGVITILLAMMYKYLPHIEVSWSDVWVGAIVSAVLFTAGKYAIGLYLGKSAVASTFGAAGSLAVLLIWVYYSAQVLFLGAEFTQVYANRYGEGMRPSEDAVPRETDDIRERGGAPEQKGAAGTPTRRRRHSRAAWFGLAGLASGILGIAGKSAAQKLKCRQTPGTRDDERRAA